MGRVTQPFELDKAVELILDRVVHEQASRESAAPVLSGISGIDCSGKSTLAKALVERATAAGIAAHLVQADDFIIPRAERKREGLAHIDYFDNTFDHRKLTERIEALKGDLSVQLIVGEGVFLFRKELAGLWHIRIWIEMSAEQSVARGAIRDAGYFGSTDSARSEYLRRFVPAHEYHLGRDRPVEAAGIVFEVREDDSTNA
jgi:uridine kinase